MIGSVQVVPIFWGADWASGSDATLSTQLEGFLDFFVTSPLIDALAEYSTSIQIQRGTRLPSVRVTSSEPGTVSGAGRTVSDAQIQTTLQGWISASTVPARTDNTLYCIFLPPNVTVTLPGAGQSCTGFCGYHNFVGNVVYAVIPYATCPSCTVGSGTLDTLTSICGHELAEAITDPILTGWSDPNTGNEIGDICFTTTTRINGYLVQTVWSNSRCGCISQAYGGFAPGTTINPADRSPKAIAACEFLQHLFLFWKADDSSNSIYVSSSLNADSWPAGTPVLNSITTPEPPACCVFNNQIWLFWKANDPSNLIYFSTSPDGVSWTLPRPINGTDSTPVAPAVCVYNGQLYLFWRANDDSRLIYFSVFDGRNWPIGKPIDGIDSTPEAPSACVYAGRLYVLWKANDDSNSIYFDNFNGATWAGAQKINAIDSTPKAVSAVALCGGINLFWKANDDSNSIYVSIGVSGNSWGPATKINVADTSPEPPFACIFEGRLVVLWKANDSSNSIYRSILNG